MVRVFASAGITFAAVLVAAVAVLTYVGFGRRGRPAPRGLGWTSSLSRMGSAFFTRWGPSHQPPASSLHLDELLGMSPARPPEVVEAHARPSPSGSVIVSSVPTGDNDPGTNQKPSAKGNHAMPSWVEQLAWVVPCPTCGALSTKPCVRRDHGTVLEFNHPRRNKLFHEYRDHARDRATADGLSTR